MRLFDSSQPFTCAAAPDLGPAYRALTSRWAAPDSATVVAEVTAMAAPSPTNAGVAAAAIVGSHLGWSRTRDEEAVAGAKSEAAGQAVVVRD